MGNICNVNVENCFFLSRVALKRSIWPIVQCTINMPCCCLCSQPGLLWFSRWVNGLGLNWSTLLFQKFLKNPGENSASNSRSCQEDNICQLLDQNCRVEAVIFAEHLVCFEFSFGIDELKKRREYDHWSLGRLELHFFHNWFINQLFNQALYL